MGSISDGKQFRKRPLFSQEVRDVIQRAILSKELKPGDRVVETRWAKALGVSQSPVREAIRELEMMGLVKTRPFQGAFVKSLDKTSIIDLYNARRGLEAVAIESAVEKISDQELVELYIVMKDMDLAVENNDFDLFAEKDSLFHEKILRLSDNALLLRLWNQCKIREYTRTTAFLSNVDAQTLSKRHSTIYDALAKRDRNAALAAIDEHFKFLIEQMKNIISDEAASTRPANGDERAPSENPAEIPVSKPESKRAKHSAVDKQGKAVDKRRRAGGEKYRRSD